MFLSRNGKLIFICIIVLFFVLRVPGLYTPYHQDEYKWPLYAEEKVFEPGSIPHPPLTEFIYRIIGQKIGLDNFRFIPLTFGFLNLLLLFYLVKIVVGTKAAYWSSFLFTISFLSILANLMVDVDGSVMPFFFLLMAIGHFKLREKEFKLTKYDLKWVLLFIIGAVGGFLVKMSGVLPLAAVLIDFAIIRGMFADKSKLLKFIGLGIGLCVGVIFILLLAKLIFPFFPLEKSLEYWKHFATSSSFLGRGWGQTFIQVAKSVLYASPLLILPLLLINKEIFKTWRPMFSFIFFGVVFYIIIFDFSIGALDRYLQFLVVPLCIIVGTIFAERFEYYRNNHTNNSNKEWVVAVLASAVFFTLQLMQHFSPPLYPKTLWVERVIHLQWNFLFPFMGGSGPLPFYVSFLFMIFIWGAVFLCVRKKMFFTILILGLLYNGVFTEEYLFGKINGSSPKLVADAVAFIANNEAINNVLVYNDNGGYDIRKLGKYERRIYATPQFEDTYKEYFDDFSGHILYINIPTIDKDSLYQRYFDSCKSIYQSQDKYINSEILDCS